MNNTKVKVIADSINESELLEEVNKQIIYFRETGNFINKIYRNRLARLGDPAGYVNTRGYLLIKINNKSYLAHRLAWLIEYGTMPKLIDHINGNTLDNRICNLREASFSENVQNSKKRKNNKLGIKGIYLKDDIYYSCCVSKDKKRYTKDIRIDSYLSPEQALEAAIIWVRTTREILHKEFTNHG